ncbi:MAG TPA: TetR/AcrR family transcriptional regulator [Rhizomicrobium sp.]|nr:TetR/AcrR family transcriptional regulator [Rhizomicrobium sp.]
MKAAPTKRIRKGSTSRDSILSCAVELFAAHGFEAMTMRLLGDAVGLDNSSLYRHFASKTALANAALDRVAGDFLASIAAHMDPSRPATLDALEALAAAAGVYFFDRPAAARLMMHWVMSAGADGTGFGVSVPATDASRPGGKLFEFLRKWLADGARRGVLRKHAMPDAVIVLFGAILLRPATYGHLLASTEPKRSRVAARGAWEKELRAAVRGGFAP